MKYLSVFILLNLNLCAFAQRGIMQSSDQQLSFYADVMVSALEADHRSYAADMFYMHFVSLLDSSNVFNQDLSTFRTLSVLDAPDNRFKLISWQVERASYDFHYYAFLVYKDGRYTELKDTRTIDPSMEFLPLGHSEWYGALYYNIIPFDKDRYIVFGYNGYGRYDHVKICDVLDLSGEEAVLGASVFESEEEPGTYAQRLVLRYSSDATVNLNYNPGLKMIVMDHLTARMGQQNGQGPTMIPDGTYEAYERTGDKWKYISKLYNHSYGENNAPRPKPVLDEQKKDIFGN